MTHAQRRELMTRRIDPWTLEWGDAIDFGYPSLGRSEAAVMPSGEVMLADGRVVPRLSTESDASEGIERNGD